MNCGGIVRWFIDFVKILVGVLFGGLVYVNIIVVMLFGVIFGLVVVVVLVLGSMLGKWMEVEGYFKEFVIVVNVIFFIMGFVIFFSNVFIVYLLVSGGVLIVVLFLVGYLFGIFIGLLFMFVVVVWVKWKNFFIGECSSVG